MKIKNPKFNFEYEYSDMVEILRKLGVEELFELEADLSIISDIKPLFVSDVIHKAVIEVNEEGTEAATVTEITVNTTSMPIEEPPVFIVNRPYMFVIYDEVEEVILFIGKVVEL